MVIVKQIGVTTVNPHQQRRGKGERGVWWDGRERKEEEGKGKQGR